MRRLIAQLILLGIVLGNFVPLALAFSANPPHACCVRMRGHCHEMGGDKAPTFRDTSCCQRGGFHAITTPPAAQFFAHISNFVPSDKEQISLADQRFRTVEARPIARSPRGPPHFFFA